MNLSITNVLLALVSSFFGAFCFVLIFYISEFEKFSERPKQMKRARTLTVLYFFRSAIMAPFATMILLYGVYEVSPAKITDLAFILPIAFSAGFGSTTILKGQLQKYVSVLHTEEENQAE